MSKREISGNPSDNQGRLASMVSSIFSDIAASDFDKSFSELPIDSFALLELRLKAEELSGIEIPDRDWLQFDSPHDLICYLESRLKVGAETRSSEDIPNDRAAARSALPANAFYPRQEIAGATARRTTVLNMPQMVLSGLSESWLWKQLGDMHWEMICAGLEMPSHKLVDGNGERLYATFTRLRVDSSVPLYAFSENDLLDISASIRRLGAGLFFSEAEAFSANKFIKASVMSSFTKRGSVTSNINLLKGQPTIPPRCPIPDLAEMPEFGLAYRDRRNVSLLPSQYSCEYEIIPYHDINGVGLLYFAAYPVITDICELKYMGRGNSWAEVAGVTSRDIFYFANCDANDRISYRVHARRESKQHLELETSLARKSDGALMAYIITRKEIRHG